MTEKGKGRVGQTERAGKEKRRKTPKRPHDDQKENMVAALPAPTVSTTTHRDTGAESQPGGCDPSRTQCLARCDIDQRGEVDRDDHTRSRRRFGVSEALVGDSN